MRAFDVKDKSCSVNVCQNVYIYNHLLIYKNNIDEDGIRTHAGRAQWISSPSP